MLRSPTELLSGFELLVRQDAEILRIELPGARPLVLGRSPGSDLVLQGEGIDLHHAMIWLEEEQVWMRLLGDAPGEAAARPGPSRLRLHRPVCLGRATWLELRRRREPTLPYAYRLALDLPDHPRPRAALSDPGSRQSCTFHAESHVAVLYVLGRRWASDAQGERSPLERGWCRHEEVALGVWGRLWRERLDNHLYVLLHRLRAKISQAGLDPHCLETGRGSTRLYLQDVVFGQ